MASSDDYGMLNVPGDILNAASPPGRGILDDLETQIAVLGGDPNVAVQAREIEKLAAAMAKAGVASAPAIERLDDFVPLSTLPDVVDGRPAIALADDSLAPIGMEAAGSFLIAGPPGSGRTTALATIAAALARTKPDLERILLSPRRSSIGNLPVWSKVADDPDSVRSLVDKLLLQVTSSKAKAGGLALFIENLTDFVDSEIESDLETLIKAAIKLDALVVGESETSTWGGASYSFGKPMKSGRRGIILQPDDGDEDLLKASFGRIRRGTFPPGRGFLVSGGRSRKVQLATTEEEPIAQ
jgi:S-DNA-T family DNA segregation ATPase FtsK/SpoIIIE